MGPGTQACESWWTSTYEPEEKCDISIDTTSGCHRFTFEEKFKILGCAMNRQGKARDATEERMQSANPRTKPFGKIFFYAKVKASRGRSSVEDWLTTYLQFLFRPYRPSSFADMWCTLPFFRHACGARRGVNWGTGQNILSPGPVHNFWFYNGFGCFIRSNLRMILCVFLFRELIRRLL